MRPSFTLILASITASAVGPSTSAQVTDRLLRCVPAEAWLALSVEGFDGKQRQDASAIESAAFLVQIARGMGLSQQVEGGAAVALEVIGALPDVVLHPHAVCVLDADAEQLGGGSYRLDELKAALLVHTGGDNKRLEDRIRHLLHTYVNSDTGTVDSRSLGQGTVYRLHHNGLAQWAVMEWGAVDDVYVMTLGEGVFAAIAETAGGKRPSLADDEWFRHGWQRCDAARASAAWTIHFENLRGKLRPIMAGKPQAVLDAIGLGDVKRGMWTFGSVHRVVHANALLQREEGDDFLPICVEADPAWVKRSIPPEASAYAVIDYSPQRFVRLFCDGYLAAKRPAKQQRLREFWAILEGELDFSIERDLLQQLGPRIIIHNFPRHPLNIPVARTIAVEITGSAIAVRTVVDRLMRWSARRLAESESGWASLQCNQAPDGVWYLQAGVYGPAVAVTDRWLVISFSPAAVRQNIAFLDSSTAKTNSESAPP